MSRRGDMVWAVAFARAFECSQRIGADEDGARLDARVYADAMASHAEAALLEIAADEAEELAK